MTVSEDFLGTKLQLPRLASRGLCNDAEDQRWFSVSSVDPRGKWMMISHGLHRGDEVSLQLSQEETAPF